MQKARDLVFRFTVALVLVVLTLANFTYGTAQAAPTITSGHNPTKGATGVPIDTNIVVHVTDAGEGVDQATIVMTVEGSLVTPVITGTPADYTLTYNPPTDFSYGQEVNVTVAASDLADPPNAMTPDVYSFTIIQENYTLIITPVGNGTVTLDPAGGTYASGTVVTLTAEPANNWGFIGWSGDLDGSDNPETITMDSDKTVTATFDNNVYTLTVNIVGSGTVTRDPMPPYNVGDDTEVTLTANPAAGWDSSGRQIGDLC